MGVVGRRSTGGVSMEKLLIWMTMNWLATLKKDVVLVMLVICTVLLMTVEHVHPVGLFCEQVLST